MPLTGIHNENEFFSHHYLAEIFTGDIQATVERWRKQAESTSARAPFAELRALAPEYLRFRRDFDRERRTSQRIVRQREWFRLLLAGLGYRWRPANLVLEDGAEIPILCAEGGTAGTLGGAVPNAASAGDSPRLLVLGAFDVDGEGEDPLVLKPHPRQFHGEAPPPEAVLKETWNAIVTRRLFFPGASASPRHRTPDGALVQTRPPRWVLILSCNSVLLLERGKWTHNRLLRFDFDDILSLKDNATLKATAALLHRESLLPASLQSDNESAWNGRESLLDRLDDNSHKHAFAVSEDLKHALRECIELIGNEAIRHLREVAKERIYDRPDAALTDQLSREALRYMYRLLFLFYIEARPNLRYAPLDAEAYRQGYGLERLRDLEMARLTTEESLNGHHLHHSIEQLFRLVREGFNTQDDLLAQRPQSNGFTMRPLDSRLFRGVPERSREPARGEIPGTQAAGAEPPHRARGLHRRTAARLPPHRRPQRVRRGLELGGAGTGGSVPVADRHPQGRPRSVVRLPVDVRQFAGGRPAAGVSARQALALKGNQDAAPGRGDVSGQSARIGETPVASTGWQGPRARREAHRDGLPRHRPALNRRQGGQCNRPDTRD